MRNRYLYITLLAVLGITPEMLAQQRGETQQIQYAPRLVVSITIDQLRTDYLEAFSPLYGNDGFKRLLAKGRVYDNASYPFASIDRASAIASVLTGTTPYYHSIVGQQWLNKESLRPVFCFGEENAPTPIHLQTSTLGDELKVNTRGNAIVYAVAPFQDAAVLSAGHAANGAFWISDQDGLWHAATYYGEQPAWLPSFNEQSAPAKHLSRNAWEPVMELAGTFNYYQHVGNQKPFRHKFTGNQRYVQLKTSGMVNGYVTDMAQQCVNQATMGFDRITDLLCLTYYAGNFNHQSMTDCQMELQDTYVRLDRELARLISFMEQRLGAEHVLFVITSTGYSDPESADYEKYRVPSGTFFINRTASLLNIYFGAIWGQGRWVETCFHNQLFLNHKLLESKRVSATDATTRAQEFLSQISGVRNTYSALQLISGNNQEIYKIRNGFNPSRQGDLLIEVAPGWKLYNEDNQDTELSRASYTQFPIIFYGARTTAGRIGDRVTTDRIAPTLARSIRIRAPNACSAEPLF